MFCLVLSAVGYAMFGAATSVFFLFLARIPGGKFKILLFIINICSEMQTGAQISKVKIQ